MNTKDLLERTLSIIKPDAKKRNITGLINSLLEESGLKIVASKRIKLTNEQAGEFYAIHKDKPFYTSLCTFMTSGPIVVQVLEGPDAVNLNRNVMGATDPSKADKGTVRERFAESIERNSIHGSDSLENASKEINFFFNEHEIIS